MLYFENIFQLAEIPFSSASPALTKRQIHKMVKDTQTIRRQFADELFECV